MAATYDGLKHPETACERSIDVAEDVGLASARAGRVRGDQTLDEGADRRRLRRRKRYQLLQLGDFLSRACVLGRGRCRKRCGRAEDSCAFEEGTPGERTTTLFLIP